MRFQDRREAGRLLAARLKAYEGRGDVLVLALPRGGVPVGYEVARGLRLPLDVLVARKIGLPGFPELGIGAIAAEGPEIVSGEAVRGYRVDPGVLRETIEEERREMRRRELLYRGDRPYPEIAGRTVLLVDDGLATGSTMRAAIASVRAHGADRIVVAVPVGAADSCRRLAEEADELVCVHQPPFFSAVGEWYDDFSQTSDDEVRELLQRAGAGDRPFSRS